MTFVEENGSQDLFALELIWTENALLLFLKIGVKHDLFCSCFLYLLILPVYLDCPCISRISSFVFEFIKKSFSFLIPITRFWFRSVYLYCLWTKNVQPIFMPRHGNNEVDQLAFMMIVPVVLIVLPFHFTWYHQLL